MTTPEQTPTPRAGATPPRRGPPRRLAERRVVRLAFGLSIFLHGLLFLYMYLVRLEPPRLGGGPDAVTPVADAGALRVLDVVPVDGSVALEPEEEEFDPRARIVERAPGSAAFGDPEAPPDARPAPPGDRRRLPSPIERLKPSAGDDRLYAHPDMLTHPGKSDEERVRERVANTLGAWNDSIAAEEDAARRSKDWTVKGENGERWGISSDGIHLGKITLPGPSFTNAEALASQREWDAVRSSADRARIHDRFDDRVRAIRERKDAERDEKKKSGKTGR